MVGAKEPAFDSSERARGRAAFGSATARSPPIHGDLPRLTLYLSLLARPLTIPPVRPRGRLLRLSLAILATSEAAPRLARARAIGWKAALVDARQKRLPCAFAFATEGT
jgi:hypothetical protein